MDDDYDGDIADEDLMQVLSEPSTSAAAASSAPSRNRGGPSQNAWPGSLQASTARPNAWRQPGATSTGARSHKPPPPTRGRKSQQPAELDDVPSDAFDSSPERRPAASAGRQSQRPPGTQSFRQMTLFGGTVADDELPASQRSTGRVYRGDLPPEQPTHHALDYEALKTWVYPKNLGPTRDYQFSIVKNGLFNNTLVALPTGLGKTFIAATVMLNYYRWTKDAKIVFVAPTKPLASQQVEACLNIVGIPRSQATLLTGETAPGLREGEWASKRLFFMTPQTLQNDLARGYADPKSIVLLVVDEAHRATGDYAYVKVIGFLRRFSKSFRVLALTATPGSSVESVQEVIDSLGISHVEIRTEESIDIRQYVHSRQIDKVILEPSDEILRVRDLFSKALKPICDKLSQQNIWYGRDPMGLTTFGLVKARQEWMNGPARHLNQGTKFMIMAIFSILQSVAHSIKLLNFHGIKPFHDNLAELRSSTEEKGEKGSRYKRQLLGDPNFQEMMDIIEKWLKLDGFVSHPKITFLCDNLLNHFMDAGPGSNTRAIVFSEYRDSAEEIVRTLNTHKPLISASIFVGQADSKRSAGMKQKQQIETIEKFKTGVFNVLVATSIGEEGLDIGQVDLIICYDASASPIRMLQRMGRTGRKRAGNIILLLMKGKEEEKFAEAQDNYAQMQRLICEGSRFNFRHDLSSRIVPRDAKPEVDLRLVEIPIENTQTRELPEPKKSAVGRAKKASKKKFHMPDGVETGFMNAGALFGERKTAQTKLKGSLPPPPPPPAETDFLAEIPDLDGVALDGGQLEELNRLYRDLPLQLGDREDIFAPSLCSQAEAQRTLRPTAKLKHGEYTKRCVALFRRMGQSQSLDRFAKAYGGDDDEVQSWYRRLPVPPFADETRGEEEPGSPPRKRQRAADAISDGEDTSRQKRRDSGAKGKAPPRRRKAQSTGFFSEASAEDDDGDDAPPEEEEGEDEEDEEEDDDLDLPPLPRQQRGPRGGAAAAGRGKSKTARGRGKGRTRTANAYAGGPEDRGDDCTRTSDNYESEGSDSGADLVDFIVGDGEGEEEIITSSAGLDGDGDEEEEEALTPLTTTSPPYSSTKRARGKKTKHGRDDEEEDEDEEREGGKKEKGGRERPFYVPIRLTQTQDSDDEMPDISDLTGGTGTEGGASKRGPPKKQRGPFLDSDDDDDDGEDEEVAARPAGAQRGRRRLVEDSSDVE